MPAQFAVLENGFLHMNHGPIDLILQIEGAADAVARGRQRAWDRFQTILDELVGEIGLLRSGEPREWQRLTGPVARKMAAAVSGVDTFITPMAAVAGAVADEILTAFSAEKQITRAFINNGGDIAIHLSPGEICSVAVVANPDTVETAGTFSITANQNIGGVATSGWRGRSQSLGICDAATVLGRTSAEADAMATLVANAVDLPGHRKVTRKPACDVKTDSDLLDRLVTVGVDELTPGEVAEALDRGVREAQRLKAAGRLRAAVLCLAGDVRVVNEDLLLQMRPKDMEHA